MASILYLSNKLVQFVEAGGKGKTVTVHNVWQAEAPEGSIINGIITDEEAFLTWIKAFFSQNKLPRKDISLVVNSSQFNHKVLVFPKLRDAEIKKMIPREFSEHRTENTLFTYYTLEGDSNARKQRVLATAIEKDFLLSYISFFKQAGIEITFIDSEINSLVRLFSNSPEVQKKTCLLQVLDGQEVISMLFIKGSYYYSQKNRLLHHDNLEELTGELESIRARLLQFLTSQQIKEPVETIYLCGDGQSALKAQMAEAEIFTGRKIVLANKAIKRKKIEFVYPVGNLLGKKQGISFYRQLRQEQREKRKQQEILNLLIPPGIVLAVGLLITAFMGNSYFSRVRELNQIQKKMQESAKATGNASYEMAAASVAAMQYKISKVEDIWNHLMSYPIINSSVEQALKECAGSGVSIEIKSFQRDSGVLTLEAFADNVQDINGFISNLQEQELFEAIEYSGYTYVSGVDHYNIHVICCMAESAGR